MAPPHAVMVPYPGTGNINPALQLAKLLHRHGVHVTFVNTEHNHRIVQATEGAAAVRGRDGSASSLLVSTGRRCAAPLRDLIVRLNGEPGAPPVTCVLPTGLMSFALGVARELGIPRIWCSGYVPLKDESMLTNGYLDDTIIDWIPGVPPISLGDISSFIRTTDPDDIGLQLSISEPNNCTMAGALILNTFERLDAEVLAALRARYQRVYTIGPLGSLHGHLIGDGNGATDVDQTGLSLWKQDSACLAWLDAQAPRSVVYVNFGSHTVMSPAQLAEFAGGLAASGHPFLWSIRDDAARGGVMAALPSPAASAAAAEGCRVTSWCPQEQVLRHRAVGCFVTHNGWNSMFMSMAACVPMVCWPGFADQYTNCKYACEVWGVGVRLDAEPRREQVAARVREAMASDEMKASAARWKAEAEAEAAACPGGSSYENVLGIDALSELSAAHRIQRHEWLAALLHQYIPYASSKFANNIRHVIDVTVTYDTRYSYWH
ncbi:hypothetical protein ACP4OV_012704 [Aristida adscensionis]